MVTIFHVSDHVVNCKTFRVLLLSEAGCDTNPRHILGSAKTPFRFFVLDSRSDICQSLTDMFSTGAAAKKLGLQTRTLSRYIQAGKLPAPKMVTSGGMTLHLWTEQDIERARKLLPKIANGRKTQYQKAKKQKKPKK